MPEAEDKEPADVWNSSFMQQWQEDIETLESFCSGIEAHKKRMRHASRIKSRLKRAKIAYELGSDIERMLEIPEKWRGFPAFYSDFKEYIPQIQQLKELAGYGSKKPGNPNTPKQAREYKIKRKPYRHRLATCIVGFALGAVLYTACDYFIFSPAREEREIQEKIDKVNKALDNYIEILKEGIARYEKNE